MKRTVGNLRKIYNSRNSRRTRRTQRSRNTRSSRRSRRTRRTQRSRNYRITRRNNKSYLYGGSRKKTRFSRYPRKSKKLRNYNKVKRVGADAARPGVIAGAAPGGETNLIEENNNDANTLLDKFKDEGLIIHLKGFGGKIDKENPLNFQYSCSGTPNDVFPGSSTNRNITTEILSGFNAILIDNKDKINTHGLLLVIDGDGKEGKDVEFISQFNELLKKIFSDDEEFMKQNGIIKESLKLYVISFKDCTNDGGEIEKQTTYAMAGINQLIKSINVNVDDKKVYLIDQVAHLNDPPGCNNTALNFLSDVNKWIDLSTGTTEDGATSGSPEPENLRLKQFEETVQYPSLYSENHQGDKNNNAILTPGTIVKDINDSLVGFNSKDSLSFSRSDFGYDPYTKSNTYLNNSKNPELNREHNIKVMKSLLKENHDFSDYKRTLQTLNVNEVDITRNTPLDSFGKGGQDHALKGVYALTKTNAKHVFSIGGGAITLLEYIYCQLLKTHPPATPAGTAGGAANTINPKLTFTVIGGIYRGSIIDTLSHLMSKLCNEGTNTNTIIKQLSIYKGLESKGDGSEGGKQKIKKHQEALKALLLPK